MKLLRRTLIPRPLAQVFPFFAEPQNLEQLTPPWLRFQIREAPARPIETGDRIRYRIRLMGVPHWGRESARRVAREHPETHRLIAALKSGALDAALIALPYDMTGLDWAHVEDDELLAAVVLAAHQAGIAVLPLSGPSSLVLALAASGLHGQSFAFVGYLPVEAQERAQRIKELEQTSRKAHQTQLVIETPYRNTALWQALLQHLQGNTLLSVSCGLTLDLGWSRTDTVERWRKQALTLPDDIPAVFSWLAA